jgi:hypothetical protein
MALLGCGVHLGEGTVAHMQGNKEDILKEKGDCVRSDSTNDAGVVSCPGQMITGTKESRNHEVIQTFYLLTRGFCSTGQAKTWRMVQKGFVISHPSIGRDTVTFCEPQRVLYHLGR